MLAMPILGGIKILHQYNPRTFHGLLLYSRERNGQHDPLAVQLALL